MHEYNQTIVPDAFIALYRGRVGKLAAPLAEIAARHELCEDLAQMLSERAQLLYVQEGAASEPAILKTMLLGLQGDNTIVSADEARWVILRLAELLEWQAPAL